MIFRQLDRRHMTRAFGRFLSPEQIDKLMAPFSEWDCFKHLLPRPVVRLLFRQVMTEAEALAEVRRQALKALASAPQKSASRACLQLGDSPEVSCVIHGVSADSELTDASIRPSG
jgi:hypothetical protein